MYWDQCSHMASLLVPFCVVFCYSVPHLLARWLRLTIVGVWVVLGGLQLQQVLKLVME